MRFVLSGAAAIIALFIGLRELPLADVCPF